MTDSTPQRRHPAGTPTGGQFAAGPRAHPATTLRTPLDELADAAHAAWADVVAAGAYGDYHHDRRLIDRALELGVSDDRHALASVLSHHLTPVVGWVRLEFADGVTVTSRHEADWHRRVDLALDELRGLIARQEAAASAGD